MVLSQSFKTPYLKLVLGVLVVGLVDTVTRGRRVLLLATALLLRRRRLTSLRHDCCSVLFGGLKRGDGDLLFVDELGMKRNQRLSIKSKK